MNVETSVLSTDALIGVVSGLKLPNPAILNRYFARTMESDSELIHFDVLKSKRRVAPFVSPIKEGKPVAAQGFRTVSFAPAYVKPKTTVDPSRPFVRAAGERIGGELTAQQRFDAHVAAILLDHDQMCTRREELMAMEVLRTGAVTVAGDDYPTQVVDFGRDSQLKPAALSGGARWDQSGSKPLRDLKANAKLVRQLSGTNPSDVIMGEDAFAEFVDNASVVSRLDNRNTLDAALAMGITSVDGLVFHGSIEGFRIFTYAGWYIDPADDTEKEVLPAKEIILTSDGIEGVKCYGAIKDGKAGYRALARFPKMWEEDDPGVVFLMTQSAPMIAPLRVDAALDIQVLS